MKTIALTLIRFIPVLITLFMFCGLYAKDYYLSANGNDSNRGTTSEYAWQTIEKLNSIKLKPGDQVYFRSGDIFYGSLLMKNSGTIDKPIKISSYGTGNKPIITGAVSIMQWKKLNDSILFTPVDYPVSGLYKGDQYQNIARHPNKGFFRIDKGDKISLTDNALGELPYSLIGATVRIKAVDWQSETMTIRDHQGSTITFNEKMQYSCKKDYGYFLDNKLEFLDTEGEWYYDSDKEMLFLYSKKKLEQLQNTKAVQNDIGIEIEEGIHNIVIKDLCLEKFDSACILANHNTHHIKVSNCMIKHATVYGIHIEYGSQEFNISDNHISDIRGRGISTLELSHSTIENNTIRNIGLYPLYGFNGVNNAVGIAILRKEVSYLISRNTLSYINQMNIKESVKQILNNMLELPYTNQMYFRKALEEKLGNEKNSELIDDIIAHVKIENDKENNQSTKNIVRLNDIDSIGYIGIRLDGTYSVAENNIVKNTILHMNDGGAIYCWAQHDDYTHHNTIRGNIVMNAVGSPEATPNNRIFGIGIYVDNRSHDIVIENNTVSGAKAGILLNDETYKSTITGNTTYDNLYGIMFSEYFRPGTLKDNKVKDNVFFSKQRNQRCVFNESRISKSFDPADYDSNFYGSPYYTYFLLELTYKDGVRRYHEYTLESWQEQKGDDLNSTYLAPEDPEDRGNQSFIIYNDTREKKSYDLKGDRRCFDTNGNILPGQVMLDPFESMVIIKE